ncbi:MAG: L-glutamate gamma-semialdehyde dehydrogenase [Planctomycetota bacterium]|nr:L-glutamate gamma-semialdehyde dehydrogenase [Planctomycetota bacterium]
MTHGKFNVPLPVNEPVRSYAPGSPERASIEAELERQANTQVDVPLYINGKEVRTGNTKPMVMPHDHGHVTGHYHLAGEAEVAAAMDATSSAAREWERMPWQERCAIFLRAAELLEGPYRDKVNAATMLGQSKTVHQAEIDSACELIDFFRYNAAFAAQIYSEQPVSSPGMWNRLEHRPLEGFVFALTPFNFTSIAGNLPSAPAIMGNTVVWKPSKTTILSNWALVELFHEAGVPPGVINFIPGPAAQLADQVIRDRRFAGIHYTGSTGVFNGIWKKIGDNMANYAGYPRIVGETGGKDFILAHPSAEPRSLAIAMLRGAFEFQGQKCSAASRAYIPKSLWGEVREILTAELAQVKMGDVRDFSNYVSALIDQSAFNTNKGAIDRAKASADAEVVIGGNCDDSKGYFIEPTVIQALTPRYETMENELFGPVLTVFVYEDEQWEETLELVDTTSEYALTGAVLSRDRGAIVQATDALRYSAGNFYVNDKPTGAVVGQQPFGGARASGTNDKAGSILNLQRWVSPRAIKETFNPATDWRYPFLG